MRQLPSGLREIVDRAEPLARFLTSRSQFSAEMAKPAAFLPNPKDRETSVFRHGSEPRAVLWGLGETYAVGDRSLHGVAIVLTRDVRSCGLEVLADEPPPRHGVITGWEWSISDPLMQKARQKEQAVFLAGSAVLIRRD